MPYKDSVKQKEAQERYYRENKERYNLRSLKKRNLLKRRIKEACTDYDIGVIEIGGTIGDYENIPFLFAMKSLEREIGKESLTYVLITYLPVPSHIEEMKTKPTQQAIRLLSESGIIPDFIICRAKRKLDRERKKKIG